MVDSIEPVDRFAQGRMPMVQSALTESQKTQVQSILSEYDASSLTNDDLDAINQAFRDADIRPSAGLRQTIESAGFDPDQLRSRGGPQGAGGSRPPRPQSGGEINVQALQSLQEILANYDLSNLTAAKESSLTEQLIDSGLLRTGVVLDVTA